jgi:hypothetical protein
MHQVGLAESDPAVEEQRIERWRVGRGDAPRGSEGEIVGLADDEMLEGEARIESGRCRRPAD